MRKLMDTGGLPSHEGALAGGYDGLWDDLLAFPTPIDVSLGGKSPCNSVASPSSSSSNDLGSPVGDHRAVFPPARGGNTPSSSGESESRSTESLANIAVDSEEKPLLPSDMPPTSQDANTTSSTSSPGAVTCSVPTKRHKSLLEVLWKQGNESGTARRTTPVSKNEQASPSSLTWAEPSTALLQVAAQPLPNADTMELRRLKNRECMRRTRQRQREDYTRLKASVARLEKQYVQLCMRGAPALEDVVGVSSTTGDVGTETTSAHTKEQGQRRYLLVLALSKRLRAENLYLKAGLQRHSSWKQHLHRILDSTVDSCADLNDVMRAFQSSAPPSSASPMSRGATAKPWSISPAMVLHLNVMDAQEAEMLFKFSPLDDSAVSHVMVDNAHQTQEVRASLMAATQAKDPRVRRHFVIGWDVIQLVRGNYMEYMFTKTFKHLDVDDAGQKMWMNDMQTDTFRRVLSELRRIEVLQRVSPNAYILGRDVKPFDGNTVFRSVFMRFRTQVSREIPNGSSPPLKATGFVIGSHSVNRDWSSASLPPPFKPYRPGEGGERPADLHDGEALEWADMALLTEFVTIEDPTTGEKYHQIQWIGRTDFKSHAEAIRNAPDVLSVCLRTELLFFSPAIRLLT